MQHLRFREFGSMRVEGGRAGGVTATNNAGSEFGGIGHGIAISVSQLHADNAYFVCTIDRSRDNDGEGIYIGVASIDEASLKAGTPSGQCWIVLLSTGQVWHGSGTLIDPTFSSS